MGKYILPCYNVAPDVIVPRSWHGSKLLKGIEMTSFRSAEATKNDYETYLFIPSRGTLDVDSFGCPKKMLVHNASLGKAS